VRALPPNPPVAAFHLLDRAPDDVAHVLALDRHHRVGQLTDHLALLLLTEHVLDDPNLNERHWIFPFVYFVMSNGAGKNASRQQLLVVAEDPAFASINAVPKSGASALSLGVDYRRHQLVYKFDRKQISARHGPLVVVPQFVDQMLTRQRAGRSTRR
jgi:hypothetical protein